MKSSAGLLRYAPIALLALLGVSGPAIAAVHVGPECGTGSLQEAIDLSEGEEEFRVDAGTYATNLVLTSAVKARRLRIAGGYVDCSDERVSDPAATVLTGAGSNRSVVTINNAIDAAFDNLTITGGSAASGGGVAFEGHGVLEFSRVRIAANAAQDGGGIAANGIGGEATVRLGTDVLVSGNTVGRHGGGVFLSGHARLYMTSPQSAIAYNTALAEGAGGGIAIVGPARADIGSPGFLDEPVGTTYGAISHNRAAIGAGAEVAAGGVLRIFSTDPRHPVAIRDNGSIDTPFTSKGGGVHVAGSGSGFCAWGYDLSGNAALGGAAVSAEGAPVNLVRDLALDVCGPESATTLGARECATGDACNRIEANVSRGSTVELADGAQINADRFAARRNVVDGSAGLLSADARISLQNCLIADNKVVMLLNWSAQLLLDGCTIAGNYWPGIPVDIFHANGVSSDLVLGHSIVWQPGNPVVGNAPHSMTVADVLTSDAQALSAGTHSGIAEADPLFANAQAGDYRPTAASPAIDYAGGGQAGDLVGAARGIAATPGGAGHGWDIGAFESGDRVFADGTDGIP